MKSMNANWKRIISGFLALIMVIGMFPASAFATGVSADSNEVSTAYAPTSNFDVYIAGTTGWTGVEQPLTV